MMAPRGHHKTNTTSYVISFIILFVSLGLAHKFDVNSHTPSYTSIIPMHLFESFRPAFLDMMPSFMLDSTHVTTALASVGSLSLLLISFCFIKLLVALKKQSDVATAFLPAPPRDAFSGRVFWITGASSGIVSAHLI
jgi:hypothetical protein